MVGAHGATVVSKEPLRSTIGTRRGGRRPYRGEPVRRLGHLLQRQWPGVFVADGVGYELDLFVCREVGVLVWIRGVTDSVPGATGLRLVMLDPGFDEALTLRRVGKAMRQESRKRFTVKV